MRVRTHRFGTDEGIPSPMSAFLGGIGRVSTLVALILAKVFTHRADHPRS